MKYTISHLTFLLLLLLSLGCQSLKATEDGDSNTSVESSENFVYPTFSESTSRELQKNHPELFKHQYVEREHTIEESVKTVGLVYGLTWVLYPTFQPKVFKVKNGFETYKKNFGKLVFDKDEPIWNNFVHPLTGSQLYLIYRADGYSRIQSLGMAAISSALFEFTVEILTEPASVQDLYQTPILGSILGLGIENLSMYLLNQDSTFSNVLGHMINPATLLPLYNGRTLIVPRIDDADKGAMVKMEFIF